MDYLLLKFLCILTILCINLKVCAAETQNEVEEQESEEFKNALAGIIKKDNGMGYTELRTFFESLNKTVAGLTAKMEDLQKEFKELKANSKINTTDGLSTESVHFESTTMPSSLRLEFLAGNFSWAGFDSIIQMKPKIQIGKSFNGSDLSTIKARASSAAYNGYHTVVVVANHLNEEIHNFTMYDEENAIYNPAPNSIPPHTEEIFTFAGENTATSYECVHTAFSYVIPSVDVRIAAISHDGTAAAGLAFVLKSATMKSYWDTQKGIAGSFAYESSGGNNVDRKLSVGYQNLYARLFAAAEGVRKTTVRIELIELP